MMTVRREDVSSIDLSETEMALEEAEEGFVSPCHSSGIQSPASQCRGPGSIPGQSLNGICNRVPIGQVSLHILQAFNPPMHHFLISHLGLVQ